MNTLDHRLKQLSNLSLKGRNQLMAVWMSKLREEGFKTLDLLFYLDDEWKRVYEESKRHNTFTASQLLANTHVLGIVYGD